MMNEIRHELQHKDSRNGPSETKTSRLTTVTKNRSTDIIATQTTHEE